MANLSKVLKDILGETRSSDSRYFRFHNSPDGMSDWGHAMYIEARPGQNVHDVNAEMSNYGNNAFEFNYKKGNVIPISALNKDILKEYASSYRKGNLPSEMEDFYTYGGKARELLETFNPEHIVDSAGAYDNASYTGWLFENVLAPRGIQGVLTQDGAISFEKRLNKLLGSRDDGGDLPSHIRSFAPWAIGGGLAAGSVLGGGEAQASPYTHADANNLDRTIERLSKSLPLNDMASGMIPRATQASVQPINNMGVWQQMEQQGRVTPDLPVPEAEWSPVDLATAPIGAAGKVGKLAAMALDAPTSLAVNRLIDALSAGANTASNWWNGK